MGDTAPRRPLPPSTGDRVVADVLEARFATRARPPQLGPAIGRAVRALENDDVDALDLALRELAVAAMATLTRIRMSR